MTPRDSSPDPHAPDPSSADLGPPGEARRKTRRRRPLRVFLWAVILLLVIAIGLFAALPSILSTDWGTGIIENGIGSSLDAPVEIADLDLSWGGPQRITGFRLGTPASVTPPENLLEVESIQLDAGLWSLLTGKREIEVAVEKPIVRIRRDEDGTLSYEGLGGPREEKAPEEAPEPRGGDEENGGLGDLEGRIRLVVNDGELHFRDEVLDTASSIRDLDLNVDVDAPRAAVLELAALVGPTAAAANELGTLQVKARAEDLAVASREPARATIIADGRAERVDLRPYEPLLVDLWGVRAPEKPIDGSFHVETNDAGMKGTLAVDAGFVVVKNGTLSVPRELDAGPARVELPYELDLASLVRILGERSGLPEGAELTGGVSGALRVAAPVSVATLAAGSEAPDLAGVALELDAEARKLHALLPSPPPPEDKAGATPEKQPKPAAAEPEAAAPAPRGDAAEPQPPIVIDEEQVSLALRARTGENAQDVRIDELTITSRPLDLRSKGTVLLPPPAAEGTGRKSEESPPVKVDLALSLELALPALVEELAERLPEGVRVGPDSRAKVENLVVRGEVGGGRPPLETLNAAGHVTFAGAIEHTGVRVETLDADLRLAEGMIVLENVTAKINQGTLKNSRVALGLGAEKPPFDLDLDLDAAVLDYGLAPIVSFVLPLLPPEAREADIAGALSFQLKLSGKGFDFADLKQSLTGGGAVLLANGRLESSPFFQSLGSLIGAELGKIGFESMGSEFRIGSGKISSDSMYFEPKEGKIRRLGLVGSTGFDRTIDYGVRLRAVESAIGDDKIRRILETTRKVLGEEGLPLRLEGTIAKPRLSLALEDVRIPGLEDILRGAIPGVGSEKGEKALPGLEDVIRGGAAELRDILGPRKSGSSQPSGEKSEKSEKSGDSSGGKETENGKRTPVEDAIDDVLDIFGKRKKPR